MLTAHLFCPACRACLCPQAVLEEHRRPPTSTADVNKSRLMHKQAVELVQVGGGGEPPVHASAVFDQLVQPGPMAAFP